jgi:hypothetical protein
MHDAPRWQKAKVIGGQREHWVPTRTPEHDDYYETSEGDWLHKDYVELLPEFSDSISDEGRYP